MTINWVAWLVIQKHRNLMRVRLRLTGVRPPMVVSPRGMLRHPSIRVRLIPDRHRTPARGLMKIL